MSDTLEHVLMGDELAGALADLLPYCEGLYKNLSIARDDPHVDLLGKRIVNAKRLLDKR